MAKIKNNNRYKFKKEHFKNKFYQNLNINQKISVKADSAYYKASISAFEFMCLCEPKM